MLRPETRETMVAYTLGAIGAVKGIYEVGLREPLAAKMQQGSSKPPNMGLTALVGGFLAYELFAPRTITKEVRDASRIHPLAVKAAIGVTALHLLDESGRLERIDPIQQFGKRARGFIHHE